MELFKTSVLSTCFTFETKIISISVSVRLVTRVGEVTICDKLCVRQKFVKALDGRGSSSSANYNSGRQVCISFCPAMKQ